MKNGMDRLDSAEHTRAVRLEKATRKRPHIPVYKEGTRRGYVTIRINTQQCPPSSALVLGDMVRKKMLDREHSETMRADCPYTEHVRDGKPLTAYGAGRLGVPWPQ